LKEEKTQNPSIFLATYWNSSSNSGNLQFFFLQNLVNLGFVSNSKSFRKVEIKIFRLKFGEILPKKKRWTHLKHINLGMSKGFPPTKAPR
jgi:hypothetical protein